MSCSISPVAPTGHLNAESAPPVPKAAPPQPTPEKQDSVILSSAAKAFGDVGGNVDNGGATQQA
jgi:hypothetical protein